MKFKYNIVDEKLMWYNVNVNVYLNLSFFNKNILRILMGKLNYKD